ncbi:MAG: hypothetical protein IIT97_03490 [Mycoplasmataceae bacterium]|nr:hypothetical protein [Mycoplasmataceae bacterium]
MQQELNKIKSIKIVHPDVLIKKPDTKQFSLNESNNQVQTLSDALKNSINSNKEIKSTPLEQENAKKEFFKLFHKDKKQHTNNLHNSQLIVDDNGILHLNINQVHDIMTESIVGEDKRVYLNHKIAAKYGLLNPKIKEVQVEDTLIPVQELTKQEVKKIKHDEKVKKHLTKKNKHKKL